MPTFCRHNRLVQNCPICAREQDVELRPVVSPGGRPEPRPSRSSSGTASRRSEPGSASRPSGGRAGGMTVRRLAREADDGYGSPLVPGIRSGADAARLAEDLACAATRLELLAADPPGLYAEVAGDSPLEERTWLAVQIALLGPLETGSEDGPFAAISAARSSWESGEAPALAGAQLGPRAAGDEARAARTVEAYRAWATRLGSQAAGFQGEASWSPERRFDRVFERLGSLAAMNRDPRYDLLVTLGRLGVYELSAGRLHVGGSDRVTLAAKRILGIGDPMLLERRAADLAEACELPLEALDLGFFNWEVRSHYGAGMDPLPEPDPERLATALSALGVD
jgi:Alpha-glutamyl/putrescinyl thymine pyrophosphorylase clade 3